MTAKRLTVRLPEPLLEQLSELSQTSGTSQSQIVRDALKQFLAALSSGPSCYDLGLKAGWIGCFDSGLGDLSTNPRYMEGFGESQARDD